MLEPDAFCEHTMQQNATATGAPPQTPLWKNNSAPQSPDSLAGLRGRFARQGGRKGRRREREKWGREGGEGEGSGGKVDSCAVGTGPPFG